MDNFDKIWCNEIVSTHCLYLHRDNDGYDTIAENQCIVGHAVTSISENVTSITENVTSIAENVTSVTENVTLASIVDIVELEGVTPISENVTPATDTNEEELKKKNKKENTPTTLKEKNKIKTTHTYARASNMPSSRSGKLKNTA